MRLADIAAMPTLTEELEDPGKSHESCLRAYHIVQKVQDLLQRGTPTDVVLELIGEMEYREPEGLVDD